MSYSPSTSFAEYLDAEQKKYPQLKAEDLQALKDDLADDPNLPPISDKKYLAFLHSCCFDVELAKKTIKRCYKFYFDIPQVFCELDPLSKDIENCLDCVSIGQVSSINADKSDRILYFQFKEHNHNDFAYVPVFKYLLMWMEYTLLTQGTCNGMIAIVDSKGLGWRHIVKLPIAICAKLLKFLEVGLPVRLKEIHVLNTGSYTQMILKMVLKFANQELIDKIKVHSAGSEELFNYVPKKVTPIEFGGLGESHQEQTEKLYNEIAELRDIYFEQNEVLTNHMSYMNQQAFLEIQ